jgi:uncharacterized protein YkwD
LYAAEPGEPRLTAEQREQLSDWITQFRRARETPEQRREIADKIFDLGPVGAQQLLSVVKAELSGRLGDYRKSFHRRAASMSGSRLTQVDFAEVKRLQSQVLALRTRDDLSKEMIVREADPVLAKLREMFVVDRAEVLAQFAELQEQRGQLLELGKYWELCTEELAESLPEAGGAADTPPSFEKYLQGEEQLAAQLAAPMDSQTRAVLSANARLASRLDKEEARAIVACNLTRALLGLPPLSVDLRLCAAARDHSSDMERLKFFSHTSPVRGKESLMDRAENFGTTTSAENIYQGIRDGVRVTDRWFHSPGHHCNMLGPHRRIGVGRSGVYFTEMFGM